MKAKKKEGCSDSNYAKSLNENIWMVSIRYLNLATGFDLKQQLSLYIITILMYKLDNYVLAKVIMSSKSTLLKFLMS